MGSAFTVFSRPNLHRSIPNGAVELRCRLGSTPELVGPLSRPCAELLAPGTTVIGLRLRPAVAGSVFGAPASEFVDMTVGVDDVWGEKARAIGERLAELTVPGELVTLLQELLLGRVPDEDGSDRLVSEAVKRMMQPRVNGVGQIRSSLAVSERQLRRRFLTATGVPPKAMQRMVRFQGLLAEAQFAVARGVRPSSTGWRIWLLGQATRIRPISPASASV